MATAWLNERCKTRAGGTVLGDSKSVNNILIPRFGSTPWHDIRRSDVPDMIFDLVSSRLNRSTRQVTVLKALRLIIKWQSLRLWAQYDSQIFANLEYPLADIYEEERKGRALMPEEVDALLEALPYQLRPLVQIMTLTALRIGEALAMKWKHYTKEEEGTAVYMVERTFNQEQTLVKPKTAGLRAAVRLGAQAVEILEKHRAEASATTIAKSRMA